MLGSDKQMLDLTLLFSVDNEENFGVLLSLYAASFVTLLWNYIS